jgi:predicted nucleic acid-binding protein
MPAERVAAPAFFLDTNVVVYSFSERDSIKREAARALVEADGAWVSTQVLSELANVLTRRLGVPVPETRERIMSIAAGCEVVLVSPPIVYEALRIKERFGYNFFDSQIIAAALACGASVLYSEDMHHGQMVDGKLSIRSPFRLRAEQRAKPYRTTKRRARIESSPDPAGSLRHHARGKRKIPFKQAREQAWEAHVRDKYKRR